MCTYVVCSKSIANFEFPRATYIRFFCGVTLVLIPHLCQFKMTELLLGRVLARLRFLPIPKKWIKESVSKFQGATVNKEHYMQIVRNLREAIRQKRPHLWKNKNWLLHYDNAPAYTSLLVCEFLAKNNTIILPQPLYSPDLATCDFFLFPKLKRQKSKTSQNTSKPNSCQKLTEHAKGSNL